MIDEVIAAQVPRLVELLERDAARHFRRAEAVIAGAVAAERVLDVAAERFGGDLVALHVGIALPVLRQREHLLPGRFGRRFRENRGDRRVRRFLDQRQILGRELALVGEQRGLDRHRESLDHLAANRPFRQSFDQVEPAIIVQDVLLDQFPLWIGHPVLLDAIGLIVAELDPAIQRCGGWGEDFDNEVGNRIDQLIALKGF